MRTVARALILLLVVSLASGCSRDFRGLSDLPLPGGVDVGDDPIVVTITSADVLNLATRSTVKVDDVTVGQVSRIDRVGWDAEITIEIRNDVRLPANAVAAVRQTGLLGEKFVELSPPPGEPARGRLADGAHIDLDRASRSFEVEEVLSSLSLLLNGGGLENIKTITVELHQALEGREEEFRGLLAEVDDFTGTLAANRTSINAALDGIDDLSRTLARGTPTIEVALDRLGPALRILADQREAFVGMLEATSRLSKRGISTVRGVRADLVANLRALRPTLESLSVVGDDLPQSLKFLLSYPFPDSAMQSVKGDYVNFDASYKLKLRDLLGALVPRSGAPTPAGDHGRAVAP